MVKRLSIYVLYFDLYLPCYYCSFLLQTRKLVNIVNELCPRIAGNICAYKAFHFCVLFQIIWSLSSLILLLLTLKDIFSTETPLLLLPQLDNSSKISPLNLTPILNHQNNFPSSLFWRTSISWHLKNNLKYFTLLSPLLPISSITTCSSLTLVQISDLLIVSLKTPLSFLSPLDSLLLLFATYLGTNCRFHHYNYLEDRVLEK